MTNRLLVSFAILFLLQPVGNLALATPEERTTSVQQVEAQPAVQPTIARPARSLSAAWAMGAGLAGVCILLIVLVWKGYIHPSILDERRRI